MNSSDSAFDQAVAQRFHRELTPAMFIAHPTNASKLGIVEDLSSKPPHNGVASGCGLHSYMHRQKWPWSGSWSAALQHCIHDPPAAPANHHRPWRPAYHDVRVDDRPCCIGHITSATVRLTDRPCASLCLWLLLHPLYGAKSPIHGRLTSTSKITIPQHDASGTVSVL